MPTCKTRYFGELEYEPGSELHFPAGLPGFEQERRFVPIDQPHTRPLVYLQSLGDPQLCFVAMPARAVDPDYRLDLDEEALEVLGLAGSRPEIGCDLLCVALISIRDECVTANLMAPVVASLATRQAVQAISTSGRYSHRHELSRGGCGS